MQLPVDLTRAVEGLAARPGDIGAARELSARYFGKRGGGDGASLLCGDADALARAYVISRMPATYAAVLRALEMVLDAVGEGFLQTPVSLCDLGAGPGTSLFAATQRLSLSSATLLEREPAMIAMGQTLLAQAYPQLAAAYLSRSFAQGELPQADILTAAYSLVELPPEQAIAVALEACEKADKFFLLVEPGTPAAFGRLRSIRDALIQSGMYVYAPCVSNAPCPHAEGEDWCAFSVRVARSALHRAMKMGDAPFEDEKFCVLAAGKTPLPLTGSRIVRHPQIQKGFVQLSCCGKNGAELKRVTRSMQGFKQARKASQGDLLRE